MCEFITVWFDLLLIGSFCVLIFNQLAHLPTRAEWLTTSDVKQNQSVVQFGTDIPMLTELGKSIPKNTLGAGASPLWDCRGPIPPR